MTRARALLPLLGLLALALACEAPWRPGARAFAPPHPAADGVVRPAVLWRHADGRYGEPALDAAARRVYVSGSGLACLDAETGAVLGEFRPRELAGGYWLAPPVLVEDGVIAAHSYGTVARLDRDLSAVHWILYPFGSGPPLTHAGTVAGGGYVIVSGEEVLSLDVVDGRALWQSPIERGVAMRPATDGRTVFLGTRGGSFLALDAVTGQRLWENVGPAEYGWSDPAHADGVVYVGDRGIGTGARPEDAGKLVREVFGDRGGALNAFDARTGEHLWGRVFGARGLSTPFVAGDRVYVGFGTAVMPFGTELGQPLEELAVATGRNPYGSPQVVGDSLVFGNLDGHLYVHELATGALRWALLVESAQVGPFVHTGERVYVSSTRGLFALGNGEPDRDPSDGPEGAAILLP